MRAAASANVSSDLAASAIAAGVVDACCLASRAALRFATALSLVPRSNHLRIDSPSTSIVRRTNQPVLRHSSVPVRGLGIGEPLVVFSHSRIELAMEERAECVVEFD